MVFSVCSRRNLFPISLFISVKALDKLNRQLAEAEAALAARKKPPKDSGPRIVGEGLVIDEWVSSLNIFHLPVLLS